MEIPSDIVFNILLRLPILSLLRFKSVCKSWNSLTSFDSHFFKSYFQQSNECTTKLMVFNTSCSFYSIDYEKPNGARKELDFDPPFLENRYYRVQLLCSYNGLLLFQVHYGAHFNTCPDGNPTWNTLVLWNPCIGKYKVFKCEYAYFNSLAYGICYDSHVVILLGKDTNSTLVHDVLVCDLERQTSRMFNQPNCNYEILPRYSGVLLNGMLHWFSRKWDDDHQAKYSFLVVYYDLSEAKFKELPIPTEYDNEHDVDIGFWYGTDVAVFRGKLCLYANHKIKEEVKIWVMGEYGNTESWVCLMVFPAKLPYGISARRLVKVLGFTKKGEILLKTYDKQIKIYNPLGRAFRTVCPSGSINGWGVTTYVENEVFVLNKVAAQD